MCATFCLGGDAQLYTESNVKTSSSISESVDSVCDHIMYIYYVNDNSMLLWLQWSNHHMVVAHVLHHKTVFPTAHCIE